jgi:MFS transporter, OPA family, solute carrier family 37 (glycerol-3-phosphate transporter), member 1/2
LYAKWAPFSGPRGLHHLSELDVAFLSAYVNVMFSAGHLIDRRDLRRLLDVAKLAYGASSAQVASGNV